MKYLILLIFCFASFPHDLAQKWSLDEKVHLLQESLYKKPVIHLNMDRWKNYVKSAPRNYSMIVLLTTLSSGVDCSICRPIYDNFFIVANSYRYAHSEKKALYFSLVDYAEETNIFKQLNLNTAPVIYHFPAKGARKRMDQMDFHRLGIDAQAIANFVADRTDIQCIVFAFESGQMWNHIRGPPFIMNNPNTKEMMFVHSSTQFQLVAETYLVAILYATITAGFILMNEAVDGKGNSSKKRIMAFAGVAVVVVFFSLLLSIFRSKYQSYPYSFLFH